jgi:acetoin utilization deacetylase AcuC-like enzyme
MGIGGEGALRGEERDEKSLENNKINDNNTSKSTSNTSGIGMSDTYVGSDSFSAALCAGGVACRAVDVVMRSIDSNVFACTRPPGHHAGNLNRIVYQISY